MGIIEDALREEKSRNQQVSDLYQREIDSLPRGSLTIKQVGSRRYCYLRFREGKKVRLQYVGKAEEVETDLRAQIDRRRELESLLKDLKSDMSIIRKVIRD
ncbi:MAG: hypothetical protein FWE46_02630 [Coriobacteriia bacterium]|nr:hypothetical protein [Coriobacteriia bacterium]MCL2537237.1 hypothetical protein [Coriobacteriia bacterium]